MNLLHEQVQHQKFGTGVITEQTQSLVSVQFAGQYGTKKFLYPTAFDVHLTLTSPAPRESLENELRQIRQREKTERERRETETERHRLEVLLEKKRAAVKKSAPAKKTPAKAKKSETSEGTQQ
jgi:hypothetical protein